MNWQILHGDARAMLATLPDESVHCCVTSPPYYGLRDYGTEGQLGLEPTPEAYVENLVAVFAAVRRVLRKEGVLWLNLGDSYNGYPGNRGTESRYAGNRAEREPAFSTGHGLMAKGLKPKDLVGIPWRVAFALRAEGWYLRSDIIWDKGNPMPESVTDRPTKSHEYLFLLTRSPRYYYDADAIREPLAASTRADRRFGTTGTGRVRYTGDRATGSCPSGMTGAHPKGRNKRTVWRVNTASFAGAHFAVFPPALIRPCILAGCPVGGTVLDPFFGSGTTGVVARELNRNAIGIELNPEYCRMAEERLRATTPALPGLEVA